MAKFVKNPSGTVHTVDDDFTPGEEFAEEWAEGTWAIVTESDATPALLGTEPDPEVRFHELRENPSTVVDESGPAQEPGEVDGRESNDIQPADGGAVPAPDGVEETLAEGEQVVAAPEVTA